MYVGLSLTRFCDHLYACKSVRDWLEHTMGNKNRSNKAVHGRKYVHFPLCLPYFPIFTVTDGSAWSNNACRLVTALPSDRFYWHPRIWNAVVAHNGHYLCMASLALRTNQARLLCTYISIAHQHMKRLQLERVHKLVSCILRHAAGALLVRAHPDHRLQSLRNVHT